MKTIMLLYCQLMGGLTLLVVLTLVIALVSHKGTHMPNKTMPFECGFVPAGNSRLPFSIQFFLIALVFLIFDVELILLFPILVEHLNMLVSSMCGFLIFLVAMAGGLIWEWSQGSLEWLK